MEQMLVYQVIERAGNKGIWTRDIKNATNIQQQTLTKTLKALESRQLIKAIKSVTSKSKKLYMKYDLSKFRASLSVCP
jgi:DNA-directed RNA polymerase III subunit RPC6